MTPRRRNPVTGLVPVEEALRRISLPAETARRNHPADAVADPRLSQAVVDGLTVVMITARQVVLNWAEDETLPPQAVGELDRMGDVLDDIARSLKSISRVMGLEPL